MLEDFEYKVIDVYETEGRLVIEVEHEYGKQRIGLHADGKYLGKDGQPRWRSEVEEKLQKQWGDRDENKAIKKHKVFQEHIGKTYKIKKTEE